MQECKKYYHVGGARFPEGVPIFLGKIECGGARFPGVQNISCDIGSWALYSEIPPLPTYQE